MKCLSKDRNNKCCRFSIIEDTLFCKNHQYMKDYTDEMLTNLELCSGCKKMYHFDGVFKTCDNCQTRSKTNKVIQKTKVVLCSKKDCKYKRSVENKYCRLHQLQLFVDETIAKNKKMCCEYIRGCRIQLEQSYTFSKCQKCLGIDRTKDKARRGGMKQENELLKTETEKGCTTCFNILPMEQFIGVNPPHAETLTCKTCRENNQYHDLNRDKDHRNEIARKNDSKPERVEVKKQWKEDNYEKVVEYWMNSRQHKIERVGIEEYLKDNAENAQNWRDIIRIK